MVYRIGYLLQNKCKCASEIIKRTNSIVIAMGILIILLLMSSLASAETVTYYLNATAGVNIGADGITNVTGNNQIIPPVITALLDKNNLNDNDARSFVHPTGLYNHSRWYFTSDYPTYTLIGSNPSGKVVIRGGSSNNVTIRLFDYDPSSGSKNLIGSSSPIRTINGSDTNTISNYIINSLPYSISQNHRLMLQFDFNHSFQLSNARVYANPSNSYLTVVETPLTYNVTINSTPSSASIKAGENFVYSITVNNSGFADGNYTMSVSDSDTLNFLPSVPGLTTLFVPAGGSNQTNLTVTAYQGAPKDAVDSVTVTATSIEDPVYSNSTQTTTTVTLPMTYNVSIDSIPSSASINAGENFVYSITVNNTGTTDGSYNLGVLDSDTTNFSSSVLGMTLLFVPAGGSNQTTLTVTANGSALKDALDITTLTATSIENNIFTNFTQITTIVLSSQSLCVECHESYVNSVDNSTHNQTRNAAAPNCTLCHKGYEIAHTGFVVNESNTCRNCHIQDVNGFYERHSSTSDCTTCHFANTTQVFERNGSLFKHDHNLSIEHSYYEYNQSGGIPVASNSGIGLGMFPYYSCQLPCHGSGYGNITSRTDLNLDLASRSWLNSSHARSLHMSGDNKNSCAKCKSPTNYNASAPSGELIAQEDWDGIQCRVCHNLHKRNQSTIGPIAFYNSTLSSLAGYAVYEPVNSTTQLCENCHSGSSHDSKFAGTHKDRAGFNCTNCHMNSSFNNERHKFEVRNTTSSITGCEVCHDPSNHTFQFTSLHTDKVECIACHDQTFTTVNSTGYAVSSDGNYGLWKPTPTSEWTTAKKITSSPASWPLHNLSKSVKCNKCHGALSAFNGTISSFEIGEGDGCARCHSTYVISVNSSMHNQTRNASAPSCTTCHTGYDVEHTGFIVNESNTCRNCHIQDVNGFYERHSGSSDCTTCHFANTTRVFERNASLFKHDHNLSIEHSYYEYNQSGGIPVASNSGIGFGMFPYYSCQLPCHGSGYGNVTSRTDLNLDMASRSWLNSSHARSLNMSGDNKNSCAKCKSPTDYNASAPSGELIAQEDWDGIQCRVCHNLHKRNQSTIGPIAFYNSTLSSLAGYAVYEPVNSTTQLCENCHYGSSHDSKFAGTHKDTAGFNCTNCHMNSSFNNERHSFEVKNTISEVAGCEVCHDQADHTFQFTSNHTGKVTCEACHDRTVARNATGFAVSSDGKSYGLYFDPVTSEVSSWKDSHGTPAKWPLHNITRDVKCDKCHGTYSIFNGSLKQDFLIVNEISCLNCHNIAQGPVDNPLKYPAIEASLVTNHKNVDNSTGTDVLDSNDCRTCHYETENMSNVLTYSCEECHFQGSFNASLIKNHIPDGLRITTNATCSDCHNNSIGNYAYSANASVSHYETNISLIDTSDCIVCHNGEYTNNASWGNPQNISTSVKRSHNETQTSQCDLCHKDRSIPSLELVTFHNVGLQSDIKNCMGCHPTVTSLDMGEHSIMSGTNATDNGDCRKCHLEEICKLEIGYSNSSNTYYCQDCHTYYGTGPNKSRIIWNERQHGRAECINCHIGDGIYHQGNSRGSVANSTYFNRYSTPNINTTDCADCHYATNLDDAPFYAPGGGSHVITPGIGGNGACANSCHKSGNTMSKSMHAVATRSIPYKTTITVPVLDQSTVIKGTNVSITATVDFAYIYAFIDGAQYRIMSGNETIKSWTPMLAVDGDFSGIHENVIATINTDIQPGTYIVEVRGMAGGPAQNWSILYYPMNGEISIPQNTTLTILAQMGYINGTVSNGSSNLSGVIIYTTGVSNITGFDGKYSLRVPEGIYDVTASKPPTHGDNISIGVEVTPDNTSTADFVIYMKPIGTITGSVTNI